VDIGPCTTAAPSCTEWITLAGGPARSLIYRTRPLEEKNEKVTRALIMVHGQGRDVGNYFRTAVAAAFLANALDDTIVIAPRFASNATETECHDTLAEGEANWRCLGQSWRSGAFALNYERLASYELVDEILRKLARKEVFPNLKHIVVAGHSAGGQFVTRYEAANRVYDTLGVSVTYVASNSSSYAYPDRNRPAPGGDTFLPYPDRHNCVSYDRWPYGLQQRHGYTEAIPDAQLVKQLTSRPVTYLLGGLDTLPLAGFDSSCPGMAQGPNRLARGKAFANYLHKQYGAEHKVVVVELCGHNARCMFTADQALPLLFPQP
jgi:pimeloyl-ACP methyl ester carboxylesterase